MKRRLVITLFSVFWITACAAEYEPHNGDIIFRKPFVYEAVASVRLTPLTEWIARGKGKHFAVKRLADAEKVLTPQALQRLFKVGETFKGKRYDPGFEWSDDTLYCSELVWKMYHRALKIDVGRVQKMKEFDTSDPEVQRKVTERFGDSFPEDETVISPAAIFASDTLVTVYEK